MIVSEEQAQTFFEYLNLNPHPLSVAEFKLMRAENMKEELHSQLFRTSNQETVAAKEAEIRCNPEYQKVGAQVSKYSFHVSNHKRRIHAANKGLDIWEQEGHNARALERIR